MAVSRVGLGGTRAAYGTFTAKAESDAVSTRRIVAAPNYHRATAPMSHAQIPRRRKRMRPFPIGPIFAVWRVALG